MNTLSIAKTITRTLVPALFLAVVGFSLLLAPDLAWPQIGFALLKGALASVFGGVFVLILSDTIVKSIAYSAAEARASRKEGGFIYHFLKREHNELTEEEWEAEQAAESKRKQKAAA
jgi:hypothetical protein